MFKHLSTFFFHRQSLAVAMVFTAMGILFGSWATLIPFIKQKYALDDAQLGLLLLFMPLGSAGMNPFTTILIKRFGMRNTTLAGLVFMAVVYAMPVSLDYLPLVAFSLFLVGLSISTTNVAMNTCVTSLEHQYGINIMSTCHGMFSAGLMLGSILASFTQGMKIAPAYHMWLLAFSFICLAFFIRPTVMSIHEEKIEDGGGAKFVFPKGALLLMILISLCTNITEGTMADWTAVYMRDVVQTQDYFIGWGLAGYSLCMSVGRFAGDALIPRYGGNSVLKIGGVIAACGIVIAILLPYTATAIIGFAMVGAGVSCGAPILYGSSARVPGMAKGAGLATMNTFSMAGFLAGPVMIGFVSKSISLPFAFGLIAILAFVWVFLVNKVKLY
ncbi:MFS transporter [Emticicia soli]|uniref:MFS transporter n=1 Tax=Emticicia soli TaxID=2027878 RepID=A0ABW5J4F2_9BACT